MKPVYRQNPDSDDGYRALGKSSCFFPEYTAKGWRGLGRTHTSTRDWILDGLLWIGFKKTFLFEMQTDIFADKIHTAFITCLL